MAFDMISSIFDMGKTAIERIFPDPIKRAEEMRKLEELKQRGDLAELDAHVKLMLAQLEINKTEAQHASVFVSGWRPAIGWVGMSSLAYAGFIHPMLTWIWFTCQALGYIPAEVNPPPFIESGLLGTIVTGMLGIGGMRTYEKQNGTSKDAIKNK